MPTYSFELILFSNFLLLNNTARGIIAETAMSVDMCYVEEMARISFPPYRTLDCRGGTWPPRIEISQSEVWPYD